jgi:hypothetical protein
MSFLLDTNVLSESMKERPNPGVIAWLSKVGSERESGETCILRGFLKGTYFRFAGRPSNRFSPEWPINRDLAVEMALRGWNDGTSATTVLPPSELGNP